MEITYMKNAEISHGNNYPVWIPIPNTPITIRIDPNYNLVSFSIKVLNDFYPVGFDNPIKVPREFSLSGFPF